MTDLDLPFSRQVYDDLVGDGLFEFTYKRCLSWSPNQPVLRLPLPVRQLFREHAKLLLGDLEKYKLSIGLAAAPSPEHSHHMIHVANEYNPKWYSELYQGEVRQRYRIFSKKRKHGRQYAVSQVFNSRSNTLETKKERIVSGRKRTVLVSDWKRTRTLSALEKIRDLVDSPFHVHSSAKRPLHRYSFVLRGCILDRLTRGWGYDKEDRADPDLLVAACFGLEETVELLLDKQEPDLTFPIDDREY